METSLYLLYVSVGSPVCFSSSLLYVSVGSPLCFRRLSTQFSDVYQNSASSAWNLGNNSQNFTLFLIDVPFFFSLEKSVYLFHAENVRLKNRSIMCYFLPVRHIRVFLCCCIKARIDVI